MKIKKLLTILIALTSLSLVACDETGTSASTNPTDKTTVPSTQQPVSSDKTDDDDSASVGSNEGQDIAVSSVTLDQTMLNIVPFESAKLTATVAPENATDKAVVWTSSDSNVATVGADGTVTGVDVGTATITATAGEKSATCEVTVTAAADPTANLAESDLNIYFLDDVEGDYTTFHSWGNGFTAAFPVNETDKTFEALPDYSFQQVHLDFNVKYASYNNWELTSKSFFYLTGPTSITGLIFHTGDAQTGNIDVPTLVTDSNGNYNLYITKFGGDISTYASLDSLVAALNPAVPVTSF